MLLQIDYLTILNILLLQNLIRYSRKFYCKIKAKRANLATKGDIADFVKQTDFDDKLKN